MNQIINKFYGGEVRWILFKFNDRS
jgi:hypothetical protein